MYNGVPLAFFQRNLRAGAAIFVVTAVKQVAVGVINIYAQVAGIGIEQSCIGFILQHHLVGHSVCNLFRQMQIQSFLFSGTSCGSVICVNIYPFILNVLKSGVAVNAVCGAGQQNRLVPLGVQGTSLINYIGGLHSFTGAVCIQIPTSKAIVEGISTVGCGGSLRSGRGGQGAVGGPLLYRDLCRAFACTVIVQAEGHIQGFPNSSNVLNEIVAVNLNTCKGMDPIGRRAVSDPGNSVPLIQLHLCSVDAIAIFIDDGDRHGSTTCVLDDQIRSTVVVDLGSLHLEADRITGSGIRLQNHISVIDLCIIRRSDMHPIVGFVTCCKGSGPCIVIRAKRIFNGGYSDILHIVGAICRFAFKGHYHIIGSTGCQPGHCVPLIQLQIMGIIYIAFGIRNNVMNSISGVRYRAISSPNLNGGCIATFSEVYLHTNGLLFGIRQIQVYPSVRSGSGFAMRLDIVLKGNIAVHFHSSHISVICADTGGISELKACGCRVKGPLGIQGVRTGGFGLRGNSLAGASGIGVPAAKDMVLKGRYGQFAVSIAHLKMLSFRGIACAFIIQIEGHIAGNGNSDGNILHIEDTGSAVTIKGTDLIVLAAVSSPAYSAPLTCHQGVHLFAARIGNCNSQCCAGRIVNCQLGCCGACIGRSHHLHGDNIANFIINMQHRSSVVGSNSGMVIAGGGILDNGFLIKLFRSNIQIVAAFGAGITEGVAKDFRVNGPHCIHSLVAAYGSIGCECLTHAPAPLAGAPAIKLITFTLRCGQLVAYGLAAGNLNNCGVGCAFVVQIEGNLKGEATNIIFLKDNILNVDVCTAGTETTQVAPVAGLICRAIGLGVNKGIPFVSLQPYALAVDKVFSNCLTLRIKDRHKAAAASSVGCAAAVHIGDLSLQGKLVFRYGIAEGDLQEPGIHAVVLGVAIVYIDPLVKVLKGRIGQDAVARTQLCGTQNGVKAGLRLSGYKPVSVQGALAIYDGSFCDLFTCTVLLGVPAAKGILGAVRSGQLAEALAANQQHFFRSRCALVVQVEDDLGVRLSRHKHQSIGLFAVDIDCIYLNSVALVLRKFTNMDADILRLLLLGINITGQTVVSTDKLIAFIYFYAVAFDNIFRDGLLHINVAVFVVDIGIFCEFRNSLLELEVLIFHRIWNNKSVEFFEGTQVVHDHADVVICIHFNDLEYAVIRTVLCTGGGVITLVTVGRNSGRTTVDVKARIVQSAGTDSGEGALPYISGIVDRIVGVTGEVNHLGILGQQVKQVSLLAACCAGTVNRAAGMMVLHNEYRLRCILSNGFLDLSFQPGQLRLAIAFTYIVAQVFRIGRQGNEVISADHHMLVGAFKAKGLLEGCFQLLCGIFCPGRGFQATTEVVVTHTYEQLGAFLDIGIHDVLEHDKLTGIAFGDVTCYQYSIQLIIGGLLGVVVGHLKHIGQTGLLRIGALISVKQVGVTCNGKAEGGVEIIVVGHLRCFSRDELNVLHVEDTLFAAAGFAQSEGINIIALCANAGEGSSVPLTHNQRIAIHALALCVRVDNLTGGIGASGVNGQSAGVKGIAVHIGDRLDHHIHNDGIAQFVGDVQCYSSVLCVNTFMPSACVVGHGACILMDGIGALLGGEYLCIIGTVIGISKGYIQKRSVAPLGVQRMTLCYQHGINSRLGACCILVPAVKVLTVCTLLGNRQLAVGIEGSYR